MSQQNVILDIRNVKKYFPVKAGLLRTKIGDIKSVDGINLKVYRGETLGIVGESGCGKSTLGNCIMGLLKLTSGNVMYHGGDYSFQLSKMTAKECFMYSEQVQMVFQDPYSALNPLKTIFDAFDEPMRVHGMKNKKLRKAAIADLLETVNLKPDYMMRYPHEFSGGQRQRICIARALCVNPKMLVCDEPVSALDVSIQAQVLNLLLNLQQERNLTYLFIAHDLSVVQYMSNRIAVMYLGKIVELANSDELYLKPLHPYTQALLSAIPVPDLDLVQKRIILKGEVPSPANLPSGCRFHKRCEYCQAICMEEEPPLQSVNDQEHFVACHFYDKLNF